MNLVPAAPAPSGPGPLSAGSSCDLIEQAQTGLFVIQDGLIAYANPALGETLGWPVAELIGQPHEIVVAPEFRESACLVVARRLQGKRGRPGHMRCQRRDGSTLEVRAFARLIDFDGRPAVLVTLLDLSDFHDALRRAEWNADMLAHTEALCRSGSFEVEWPSGRVMPSGGLLALLGLDAAGAGPMHIDALEWIPGDERAYVAGFWRHAPANEPFVVQHRVQCADGRRLVVLHRGLRQEDPLLGTRCVAILQDITAQREAEQRIQDLANHHEVTGLTNRAALLDQLDAAMHAARWESRDIALLTIDVPRIAEIKASMGFGAGDTLAMALAARLTEACGEGELVAQLGDTEFALMIETVNADAPVDIHARAAGLLRLLNAPVRLGNTDVFSRGVIGYATFPADSDRPDGLLEAAQTARLGARGGNDIAQYRQETSERVRWEMRVESALRKALESDELTLAFQPQVDLTTGAICGAEALLRWNSAELGAVSPGDFIPIAERSGLIGAISDRVLRMVCQQAGGWRREGINPGRVSLNLSPDQLQRPDLASQIRAVLQETGAEAGNLGVEITESMAMADTGQSLAALRAIRDLGVEISLDDFGTGYSNLSSLSQLPIDVVKVDRSFVHDVTAPTQQVSVTRAIINLAHGLQMKVVAEGVETEGQLGLLSSGGCDRIQGYWFSKPVPADVFANMVRDRLCLDERFLRRRQATRTLLLVDDEENILASLRRLLRRDGYQILTATNAAEGLQRLSEHRVDVILSDQRMPGMTGVEFLHRAKELYPQTVRMALSGYTELQSIIDAVNEGAIYKFLTKPWDDERLRTHIAEAFRQKELADENQRLACQVERANTDLAALSERLARLVQQQAAQAELVAAGAAGTRAMLDGLPVGVVGVDPEGHVAYANPAAERTLGTAGPLLGSAAAEALPGAWLSAASGRPCREAGLQVLASDFISDNEPRGRLLVLLPPCPEQVN